MEEQAINGDPKDSIVQILEIFSGMDTVSQIIIALIALIALVIWKAENIKPLFDKYRKRHKPSVSENKYTNDTNDTNEGADSVPFEIKDGIVNCADSDAYIDYASHWENGGDDKRILKTFYVMIPEHVAVSNKLVLKAMMENLKSGTVYIYFVHNHTLMRRIYEAAEKLMEEVGGSRDITELIRVQLLDDTTLRTHVHKTELWMAEYTEGEEEAYRVVLDSNDKIIMMIETKPSSIRKIIDYLNMSIDKTHNIEINGSDESLFGESIFSKSLAEIDALVKEDKRAQVA